MSFPKGMRLDCTVSCPQCSQPIKPLILYRDPGTNPLVKCPLEDCGKEWILQENQIL